MILIFDSYAWIEFFLGSELGHVVESLLIEADVIVTPSIVLLEVSNKYAREGFSSSDILRRIQIIRELSKVEPINDKVLANLPNAHRVLNKNAQRLNLKRRPSMADYYILALALVIDAKIVTGDEHFRGLKNVHFLE